MYETNQTYQTMLANQIEALQNEIAELPRGSLVCSNSGTHAKLFHSIDGQTVYISAKEQSLARGLALKAVLTAKLADTLSEKLALDAYIKKRDSRGMRQKRLLEKKPYLLALLRDQPNFLYEEDDRAWIEADYPRNTRHPELLTHRTIAGHFVRSKSELIIDDALYLNKLPYRYECALPITNGTFYPDFTILHPKTHELYYWEHFRRMDEPLCAGNTFHKLQMYCECNILPSVNLITTFETAAHPLDSSTVEHLIRQYFM